MFLGDHAVDPGKPVLDERSPIVAGTFAGSMMQNEFKGSA